MKRKTLVSWLHWDHGNRLVYTIRLCVYKTMKLPNSALFKPFPHHWQVTAPATAPDTQKKLNKWDEQMNKTLNNLYTQSSSWFQNNLITRWIWIGHDSTYLWSLHSGEWGKKIEMSSRPTWYTLFQAWMGYWKSLSQGEPKTTKTEGNLFMQSLGESPSVGLTAMMYAAWNVFGN